MLPGAKVNEEHEEIIKALSEACVLVGAAPKFEKAKIESASGWSVSPSGGRGGLSLYPEKRRESLALQLQH